MTFEQFVWKLQCTATAAELMAEYAREAEENYNRLNETAFLRFYGRTPTVEDFETVLEEACAAQADYDRKKKTLHRWLGELTAT